MIAEPSFFVFEIPFCLPVLQHGLADSGTVWQGAPVAAGILDTVLFSRESHCLYMQPRGFLLVGRICDVLCVAHEDSFVRSCDKTVICSVTVPESGWQFAFSYRYNIKACQQCRAEAGAHTQAGACPAQCLVSLPVYVDLSLLCFCTLPW